MGLLDAIAGVVATAVGVVGDTATLTRTVRVLNTTTNVADSVATPQKVSCTPLSNVSAKQVNGSTILVGDSMTIVTPLPGAVFTFEPDAQNCVLQLGGVTWKVVEIGPIKTGLVTAACTLYLRK